MRLGRREESWAVAATVSRVSRRVGRTIFMDMVILAFWWFKLVKKAIRLY